MNVLYYVGFNGYSQCPESSKNSLPEVILDWKTCTYKENVLNICCTHRFSILETKTTFCIFGLVSFKQNKRLILKKPVKGIDTFQSSDKYLVAAEGTCLWKFDYKYSHWSKLNYEFTDDKSRHIWNEDDDNKILKISLREGTTDIFLLLKNGSIWVLENENKLKLLYPYDVDKAIDLASGLEHTLILTESGCVLAFGNGRGQLGVGSLASFDQPMQISSLEGLKIVKIAAGHWHSCAITDSGDLCTWGWNNYGQLAAFEEKEEIGLTSWPTFVNVGSDEDNAVIDVACGSRHTVVKLESGDLYATGWNIYGQLGLPSYGEKTSIFMICGIKKNQKRKLFVGPWYTILLENESAP